jgi:hypothetical protein
MNSEEAKLNNLKIRTTDTLLTISTVWPFDFFPDILRVDRNKVDIVYHTFFMQNFIFSILIDNINSVTVTTGPFFATLSIEISGMEKNPDDLHYLKKSDAEVAKRVILGLVAAKRNGIDLTKIDNSTVLKQLEQVGAAKT